jgi:4-amino-4-deoxy-L-arabinose transferase-like glycosyltransferase
LCGLEVVLCALALLVGVEGRLHLGAGWNFGGADGYHYMGGAMDLLDRHVYALRRPPWLNLPGDAAPAYCRVPGYSLFLAAVTRLGHPHEPGAPTYLMIINAAKKAQAVLDAATALLAFLIARRLFGRPASWTALLLVLLDPSLAIFSASILSETLATFLCTLTLLFLFLALEKGRWLVPAGAALAVAALTRMDALFLVPCFLVPWLLGAASRRQLFAAALLFCLVYSPWPLRNLVRFGAAHPLGGVCDTAGIPMERTSFYRWFATWVIDEEQNPKTLYCLLRNRCPADVSTYPDTAFDDPKERAQVQGLFRQRDREGFSEQVDRGFRDLAMRRLYRHPLRTLLVLPAQRAYHQWVSRNDQPIQGSGMPPFPPAARVYPHARLLNALLLLGGLIGLLLLGFVARGPAWIAGLALLSRAVALSLIGFVDARYTLELHPLLAVLCGVAMSLALGRRRGVPAVGRVTGPGPSLGPRGWRG